MRAWTLGSGSRGNAIVIESAGRRLLVDCGFGPRAMVTRLKAVGIAPESIEAVLVTHEHQDHSKGVARAQHKWRWPVYASAATLRALPEVEKKWRRPLTPDATETLDAFTVESIVIPHDAAGPMAFVVTDRAGGARVGIAHDMGAVPDALRARFARCDALCVEANHDVEMLRTGPYPEMLQERIRGGYGHISNAECASLVTELVSPALRAVVLLHLSEKNNTPALAARTVRAAARRAGFTGVVRAAAGRVPDAAFSFDGAGAGPAQFAFSF